VDSETCAVKARPAWPIDTSPRNRVSQEPAGRGLLYDFSNFERALKVEQEVRISRFVDYLEVDPFPSRRAFPDASCCTRLSLSEMPIQCLPYSS
jgi:hypothetical protein